MNNLDNDILNNTRNRERWDHLYDALKVREVTNARLAKLTGIAESNISHYLSGRRKPSLANLSKISDALQVATDVLLGLKPMPPPITEYQVIAALDFIENTHEQNIGKEVSLIKSFISQMNLKG